MKHPLALGKSLFRRPAMLTAFLALIGFGNANAQVTLNVLNNFSQANGGQYFGGHVENEDVYIYFTGTSGGVTYNSGATTVTDTEQIRLSSVTNGTFNFNNSVNGARVYAILGSGAPANIPVSGPDAITASYPYALMELSTVVNGKADQSFIDQVSFPTTLSNGTQTNTWSSTASAQSVTSAFNSSFPTAPFGPTGTVFPGSPYSPYTTTSVGRTAGTSTSTINANRVVSASQVNFPAANGNTPPQGTGYTNVPGFNDYLGWLQTHQPMGGWDISYNSNTAILPAYSAKLQVTGSNNMYGITVNNISTAPGATINYQPNGSTLTSNINASPSEYTANWTDILLFQGADPTPAGGGRAITTTGSIASNLEASILYTVSAAIGSGILGSQAYINSNYNTDYFFTQGGATAANFLTNFFANSQFGTGSNENNNFYNQYWYEMLQAGGLSNGTYAGYFVPYDDHFNQLGVQMASDGTNTLTWTLGDLTAVPEPGTWGLLGLGGLAIAFVPRRRKDA